MIEINENTIAIWRLQLTPDSDYCGGLTKQPDGSYKFVYRFRYYVDDKTGPDSDDKKNWYEVVIKKDTPREEVIATLRLVVQEMANAVGNPVDEILMDHRGVEGILEEMKKRPHYHMTPAGGTA